MLDNKYIETQLLQNLGKRIKAIRLEKGFRQNEIAYRCLFDKSSYNNMEAGKRNITVLNLYKIANALAVDVVSFFMT